LSRKEIHSWVEKFSQECSKAADDARTGEKETETAVGFDALVKRWDKCINVGAGYVSSRFEYHIFYVLYLFVTYLLTVPRMKTASRTKVFLCFPSLPTTRGVRYEFPRRCERGSHCVKFSDTVTCQTI
jgi:hypothetical protein